MKANRCLTLTALLVLAAGTGFTTSSVRADFTFGKPQNLGPGLNTSALDGTPCLSADGLELYLTSTRPGGRGDYDLWVMTRSATSEEWSSPVNLGPPVNSQVKECFPCLWPDGLTMYFSDYYTTPTRPGGPGNPDLWMCTRASRTDPWAAPINVGPSVNTSAADVTPTMSGDGLTMVFVSNRAGGPGRADLWITTRPTMQYQWGPPVLLGGDISTTFFDGEPALSPDGRVLLFTSDRGGGLGGWDLWMTTRKNRDGPWGKAVNLGPAVNTTAAESTPFISPDMRTLYFGSDRPGGLGDLDIWSIPIVPIVDFDGDGKVGMQDLLRLIESWGTDDPLTDIGPNPWGDGKVDANDLEVLMGDWAKEVNDPTLIAYWALDETAGMTAADSAGNNSLTVMGNATWQPSGGKIGGALSFDGKDDFAMSTKPVLDPAKGPFSVLVWVKEGAPGQTVLSQGSGANWLTADAATGALTTELSKGGRTVSRLSSQVVITDGNWHHIAFTWGGTKRRLYVDSVCVAEDAQDSLAASSGSLFIGAAKTMAPGTFWSGLIDDVRIYDRAVKP